MQELKSLPDVNERPKIMYKICAERASMIREVVRSAMDGVDPARVMSRDEASELGLRRSIATETLRGHREKYPHFNDCFALMFEQYQQYKFF